MPAQIQAALGNDAFDGLLGENELLDLLRQLCEDQTLVDQARRKYVENINQAIADAGGEIAAPELVLLRGKDGLGNIGDAVGAGLNLADIYCLNMFINDFFLDGNNIGTVVQRQLFDDIAGFSDEIADGGNFYGADSDYVNFKVLFARMIDDRFVTVVDQAQNDFVRNPYADGEINLKKVLSFA